MKLFLIAFLMFINSIAWSQTISKINGNEAVVSFTSATDLVSGDTVTILDNSLNSIGKGIVSKVSEGKKSILVNVISGKVQEGMTVEFSGKESPKPPMQKNNFDQSQLSAEDRMILERGEIGTGRYVSGGIVGTWFGFGLGHTIQGRYSEKGYIFTAGELGSFALLISGLGGCYSSGSSSCRPDLFSIGVVGFFGFRIWEIVDVWAGPPELNRRYRELNTNGSSQVDWKPMLAPTKDGALVGLNISF